MRSYAENIVFELRQKGFRVKIDKSSETLKKKIRNAQIMKIPYMLVVGDKEAQKGSVSVRLRSGEDRGEVQLQEFIEYLRAKVDAQSLKL